MGGYLAGRRDLIHQASMRLTVPGIGKECGATLGTWHIPRLRGHIGIHRRAKLDPFTKALQRLRCAKLDHLNNVMASTPFAPMLLFLWITVMENL